MEPKIEQSAEKHPEELKKLIREQVKSLVERDNDLSYMTVCDENVLNPIGGVIFVADFEFFQAIMRAVYMIGMDAVKSAAAEMTAGESTDLERDPSEWN